MPLVATTAPSAQPLIGPPPGSIAALAVSSFLLMGAVLYYVFFCFTFSYDYDGVLTVSNTNPQWLVVTIAKGENLDGNRTMKWVATIQPMQNGAIGIIRHQFGSPGAAIKNNVFRIPYARSRGLRQTGLPIPCKVRLTSAPLIEKIL